MVRYFAVRSAIIILLAALVPGQNCATPMGMDMDDDMVDMDGPDNDDMNDDDGDSVFTDAEADAVDASLLAVATIGQSTNTAQSATSDEPENARFAPITFGECPAITTELATGSGLQQFDAAIDFGQGCDVFGSADYQCAGSAAGSLNRTVKSLDLGFANLTCNDAALNGDIDVTWARSDEEVSLEGGFDLTWMRDGDFLEVDGSGTASYLVTETTVLISTFSGTVTYGNVEYTITVAGVEISYIMNAALIPSAGTITIASGGSNEVSITFNETSPVTGDVSVSINGSPSITINLLDV